MKKSFLLSIIILLLAACSQESDNEGKKSKKALGNSLLILKVDYMTYAFEGGYEQPVSSNPADADSIPILVDYKPPGDFGNIALYYQPENDLVFEGSIIWMGTGKITYPASFESPDSYARLNNSIEKPDYSNFQIINGDESDKTIPYSEIWDSISKLTIVSEYLNVNKKIGLFLYTPSVGMGDPYEWDWFVIL